MIETSDLTELRSRFNTLCIELDDEFYKIDKQLEDIWKTIERIEYKINHFGETWSEDVR